MKQSKLWAQIITENKELQNKIETGVERLRDEELYLDAISRRFREVIETAPEFLYQLNYICVGEEEKTDPDTSSHDKDTLIEKETAKDKHKVARKFLAKFTADEIKGLCKNRYSLLSMEDFLYHLNQLNAASSGNLLKDKK